MEQSTYTAISKRIGWAPPLDAVKIPSRERAQELLDAIVHGNDERAFETVFTIYRFAPSPVTVEEGLVLNTINKAFIEGSRIFQ